MARIDPNAALIRLLEAIASGDDVEIMLANDNLCGWLTKGGAQPTNLKPALVAAKEFDRRLRASR